MTNSSKLYYMRNLVSYSSPIVADIEIKETIVSDELLLYTFKDCKTGEYINITGNKLTRLYDGNKYIHLLKINVNDQLTIDYPYHNIKRTIQFIDRLDVTGRQFLLYVFYHKLPILFNPGIILEGPTRNEPVGYLGLDLVQFDKNLSVMIAAKSVIDILDKMYEKRVK